VAQHISIGFQASPPLALRVSDEELRRLHDALGGEGWHEVTAEDGSVRLNLEHVLWVRTENEEQGVGFGLT
jgi:hypothetical protein